jgi:hypothetical protein
LECHRQEFAVNPSETHAIVVGIEKYEIDVAWNLNGPAVDAARFVRWLRARGVPAKNISLFAAPLEENKNELEALDVARQPADHKTIMDALIGDFAKRRGELILLLWGGHGVIGEDTRRLFFSNVGENYLLNLRFASLLNLFRSNLMPGFSKQVLFVDACANYFELQQSPVGLAEVPVVPGDPRAGVSQFVLFGASAGERAKNIGALRTGLFSSILIEELEKSAALQWPPDLSVVQSRVEQQFVALRAAKKASQTPVHFYSRDWAGNEDTKYTSNHPDLGPAERDLVDALLKCPVMQSPSSRVQVLGELRALGVKAVDQIVFVPEKRTHTEIIVSVFTKSGDRGALIERVLNHDEKGEHADCLIRVRLEIEQQLFDHLTICQLRELLQSLQLNQPDVLRIFRECARDLNIVPRQESSNLYWLLLTLADFPLQKNGFPYPALLFAEKAANLAPPPVAAQIRQIVDQIAAQRNAGVAIRDFRTGTAWRTTPGTATLVFEMKPKAGGFVVRASLLDSDGVWTPLPTEDNPVSETAARDKFRELVLRAEEQSTNLIIEMVVAREMFCWPLERWEIDVGGYAAAVGAHYPVVLRWLDRLRDERLQRRWSAKWRTVRTYAGQPLWLRSTDQFQPGQLLAILSQAPDAGAFITFAFPPSRAAEPRGDALSVALSGGTPVAIWWRECDPDPKIAQQELEALLTHRTLEELPDVFRTVRNQAEQRNDPKHPGCRVALLFDNHDHRPPQLAG